MSAAQTVLIVGASRGIGHEFARQYAQDGARVLATYRHDADRAALEALGAQALALEVTDPDAQTQLPVRLASESLDIVILNAGVYGPRTQGLAPTSQADFNAVMHTNVWAPMQLMALLGPGLKPGAKLAVISSSMGSTSSMKEPSGWLYRASKAALGNALRAASLVLGDRSAGVVCMAFHPGWVKTDMGGPSASLEVSESVAGMRRVIAAANQSHNGKFLNYTGAQLDW
ncbi:MAG TPA: SDR family oxidoreductase [Burkholderiaceae bacterium]|nr:SDR family oxidoreductase [Burkholderiaceae bacterium]